MKLLLKNVILFIMKIKNLFTVFAVTLLFSSCALVTDEYQANQRKVIAYLLEDLPLPKDAEIIKTPTVLLGTGTAISGRIILESEFSPAENLIFYGTETLSTGWRLISSKVGEEVTLVYSKNGRFATIFISPRNTFQGFISGDYGSDVVISVVHPEAIADQNPYDELTYENLPESP
jgi:hypothetical protein